MGWIPFRPKTSMHVLHKIFPDEIRIPDYFPGKNIVHLPTVKCHIYTTTTGAMKNAFGGLLTTKRHYTHSWIHETLVDLLAIKKEIHPGIFAFMDGTTAGNGPGPRTMYPVVKNYILASADQVAIDAVAARMMGFDPLSIGFISIAHEDRLGVGDVRDIEIVGADVSKESWGFTVGNNGVSLFGNLAWFGPLRGMQKLFFRTPMVHMFILGSEAYHDYYRWQFRDGRVFKPARRNRPSSRHHPAVRAGVLPRGAGRAGIRQTAIAPVHQRRRAFAGGGVQPIYAHLFVSAARGLRPDGKQPGGHGQSDLRREPARLRRQAHS